MLWNQNFSTRKNILLVVVGCLVGLAFYLEADQYIKIKHLTEMTELMHNQNIINNRIADVIEKGN